LSALEATTTFGHRRAAIAALLFIADLSFGAALIMARFARDAHHGVTASRQPPTGACACGRAVKLTFASPHGRRPWSSSSSQSAGNECPAKRKTAERCITIERLKSA
jgi:hypothetical protein